MKTRTRKINTSLDTKVGQYFIARTKGYNKTKSALLAGYSPKIANTHTPQIERTKTFQKLTELYFKDALLARITKDDIAKEMTKVIKQDGNLQAKNTAIQMAIDKIEPQEHYSGDDNRVLIVLSDGK